MRPTVVVRYERALRHALRVPHAATFPKARRALSAVLAMGGRTERSGVLISALNCKAVPLALMRAGCHPVYADIDPESLNIRPDTVLDLADSDTAAIVFQHTYGNPDGAHEVARAARRLGILMIEDCAHAVPLARPGHDCPIGDVAVFSNDLFKPLPAAAGGAPLRAILGWRLT